MEADDMEIEQPSPSNLASTKSEAKRVLGRQLQTATPWLTERHGYDPTSLHHI